MAAPVAQEELPILEAVINIRNRLTALKKDRGEYIKPSDVNTLYQAIVKQVTRLNEVRDAHTTYNNRLDTTLADVFNLLSLFFLTIGKTKECPATYSQIASMRQILEHMDESGIYNESDLAPFHRRLAELREIVRSDAEGGKHPEAMTTLLDRQLNECDCVIRRMQESLAVLSPELVPIHERLVNVRRKLVALAAKETAREAAAASARPVEPSPLDVSQDPTPSFDGAETPERRSSTPGSDTEQKTPTIDTTPKLEPVKEKESHKIKSELKVLQEELRKIDSLSVLFGLVSDSACVDLCSDPAAVLHPFSANLPVPCDIVSCNSSLRLTKYTISSFALSGSVWMASSWAREAWSPHLKPFAHPFLRSVLRLRKKSERKMTQNTSPRR